MQNPRKQKGFIKILVLIIILILIALGFYMLSSDSFEKENPKITTSTKNWNLKEPFLVQLSDNGGIKSYQVSLLYEDKKIPIENMNLFYQDSACMARMANISTLTQGITNPSSKEFCIAIKRPEGINNNIKELSFEISVTDTSKWNFFSGNTTTEILTLNIDTKKPQLSTLANSYQVTQGGSALVIFRAVDENLKSIKVTNGTNDFKAIPFYKEGYFISLIAWPKDNESFSAKIEARDDAGNVSIIPISYYLTPKKYRTSTIPLKDSFIDGKITSLTQEIGERSLESFSDKIALFKYINEEVRDNSTKRIMSVASNFDTTGIVDDFLIKPFSPLRNGAVMASFGDHRKFDYQGQIVSESNHMGLDLASVKQAKITLSNPGVVTLNEFVGIDGNAIIIYHGLGLSTLYAHLTSSNVNVGDVLDSNATLGNTGNTGLALGDHLHFGILVQGHEVWSAEWMDANWIEKNIINIINEAKAIINQLEK